MAKDGSARKPKRKTQAGENLKSNKKTSTIIDSQSTDNNKLIVIDPQIQLHKKGEIFLIRNGRKLWTFVKNDHKIRS